MEPIFFTSPEEFRAWLAENHDKAREVWVGYYKKSTNKPTMIYQEALDEALCYGWIDGLRKSIDSESYKQRYSPRQKRSIWSQINIKRVGELIEAGRMQPAGLKAFETRDQRLVNKYSSENEVQSLSPEHEAHFKANAEAWAWFEKAAPSYRRTSIFWINSAKQEATRLRRLNQLIEYAAKGEKIPAVKTPSDKNK